MSIRESGFYRGVKENQIAKRQKTFRDIRTVGEKMYDGINSNEFLSFILFMLTLVVLVFPALLLPFGVMIIGLYLIRYSSVKKQMLVGRLPKETGLKDLSDPIPDTDDRKHFKAGGIFLVGKDRETKQEFWLADKDVLTHMLIFGTTGAGKALPLDEKVLTPIGFKDMRDIHVGDKVIAIDGTETDVVGVYPQGKEDVYEVMFYDGRIVESSGGHLWEVHWEAHNKHWNEKYKKGISRTDKDKPRIKTTLEILELKNKNKGVFSVPLPEPVLNKGSETFADPYLIGALIGDGSFKEESFRFSNQDIDVVEKVDLLLRKTGSFLKKNNSNREFDYHIVSLEKSSEGEENGDYKTTQLREYFSQINLWGKNAHEKFIPKEYGDERLSYKQRLSLIQGLMDADGTVDHHGSVSFSTCSAELAKQVQSLIWSIGGIAKISEKKTTHTYKDEKKSGRITYSVDIRVKNPPQLFSSNRKRSLAKETTKYNDNLKLKIVSIKPIGKKETQCIKVSHERSLFLTRNYVATHNTETLVSLAFNALALGSGMIYTDPKGAPKLAFQIFCMCRFMGREHDFLVVNYSVGSRSPYKLNPKKITNTQNPYSIGSAEMLSEVLNALLPLSDGDNAVFSNAAQTMVKSLMYGLVEKRNKKEIPLSVKTIREYMALDKYIELATDESLSDDAKDAMQAYLKGIGWMEGMGKQKLDGVAKQHGFSLSYFALPLASLADTYGHIYLNAKGEVDSYDVIKYRRIAFILLPALEMSPGQLKNVGQITLSSVRNACAIGLGNRLEGHKVEVIDALPTNSPVPGLNIPFISVTDEYAAIPTPGYAEVLTQGRGLGIGAIVASQDYAGIKGADEKGAKQIVANTKVKVIMAMDDPEDTWELVQKISGEVEVSVAAGFDAKDSAMGNFQDGASASFEKRARVDIMDLQSQIEGEFHGFFKGKLIRGQTFYANPNIDNITLSLNEKIGIDDIDKSIIDRQYGHIKTLTEAFSALIQSGGISKDKANEILVLSDKQERIIKGLKRGVSSQEIRGVKDRTILSIMLARQQIKTATNRVQDVVAIKREKNLQNEALNKDSSTNSEDESLISDGNNFDPDLPFGGRKIARSSNIVDDEDDDYEDIEYEDHDDFLKEAQEKEFYNSAVHGLHIQSDPVEKQKIKEDARYIEKKMNPDNYNADNVNKSIDVAIPSVDYKKPTPIEPKPEENIKADVLKIFEIFESKSQTKPSE